MSAPALPAPAASRRLPWDIHPALSEDRLRICARLLAHARGDAIRMASFEMGDTTRSVGCRAYAFGQQLLSPLARLWAALPQGGPFSLCGYRFGMA